MDDRQFQIDQASKPKAETLMKKNKKVEGNSNGERI